MKSKNITFISVNYFPEDTAIGLYSKQWVDFLESKNHRVSVISAFPYYPQWKIFKRYRDKGKFYTEVIGESNVYRYKQYVPTTPSFLKRIVHMMDFTLGSFINLFKIKECDLVISIIPFTSSSFLGYVQKKRFNSKQWIHIQDFEFDAAVQTGFLKKANILIKLLFVVESWLLSKADVSSTISHSMLHKLKSKTSTETFFLPNWIDETKITPSSYQTHEYLKSTKTKILYSGNIGDKQDWQTFIQFCSDLNPDSFEVIIVGAGSKKSWLCENIKDLEHVVYHPPVPYSDLSDLLCSADVHVLFQKTEVLDTVMPSKVLGMMASSKPSIITGNRDSEVKSIFEKSQGGVFFSKYSHLVLEELERLNSDKTLAKEIGLNARSYVIEHFSKEKILSKMLDRLDSL